MADMGENEMRIYGDGNQLQRFRDLADERLVPLSKRDPYYGEVSPSVLSFHRLYPIPEEVIARGYNPPGGGYDWQETRIRTGSMSMCFKTENRSRKKNPYDRTEENHTSSL